MNHYAIDHIVRERIAEHRLAAEADRLVAAARRARRTPAPAAATATTRVRTGDLAVDLATLGVDAVEHEVARFVRRARRCGAVPDLVAVLADRDAPDVVRQRAFTRIARSLDRQAPAPCAAAA